MWTAGIAVAVIAETFGLKVDTVNLVRIRFGLAARTARTRAAMRTRPRDPTPEEIAAALVELRAKHLAKRLAEPVTRRYRTDDELGGRIYPCDVFDIEE